MATLNEFLEKALSEGVLVGDKVEEAKKGGYSADVSFNIKLTGVNDMEAAMKKAQRFVDDVKKKFSLFKPSGEVDGVDEN
jgi:hypothetical protein